MSEADGTSPPDPLPSEGGGTQARCAARGSALADGQGLPRAQTPPAPLPEGEGPGERSRLVAIRKTAIALVPPLPPQRGRGWGGGFYPPMLVWYVHAPLASQV